MGAAPRQDAKPIKKVWALSYETTTKTLTGQKTSSWALEEKEKNITIK